MRTCHPEGQWPQLASTREAAEAFRSHSRRNGTSSSFVPRADEPTCTRACRMREVQCERTDARGAMRDPRRGM